MKLAQKHLPKEKDESFVVKDFNYDYNHTPWHYHPGYNIVLVTESTGKRFIVDSISNFQPRDPVSIVPNTLHIYKNDEEYHMIAPNFRAKPIVIHFTEEPLGKAANTQREAD